MCLACVPSSGYHYDYPPSKVAGVVMLYTANQAFTSTLFTFTVLSARSVSKRGSRGCV